MAAQIAAMPSVIVMAVTMGLFLAKPRILGLHFFSTR